MVGLQLKPWLYAATVWGFLSLVIIREYLRGGETEYLNQLWFLLSLLWIEFGAAALFNSLIHRRRHQLLPLLMVTLVPPSIFFVMIYLMLWLLIE